MNISIDEISIDEIRAAMAEEYATTKKTVEQANPGDPARRRRPRS